MLEIFLADDAGIHKKDDFQDDTWIALTAPTAKELLDISEKYNIDIDHLRAPLDEEERSRVEFEDDYTLILVDVPTVEVTELRERYITIPMAIIIAGKNIITVCLEENSVLKSFKDGRVKQFYTFKKTRFILQILYRNATVFLQYLRVIDRRSEDIEKKMHISTENRELIEMLELEKSLVYFSTSLKSNEVVLEKLLRSKNIKQYPEDTELLEDVIIENKQAIEMAAIYSGILSSMTEAFASIINNNVNKVMKFLATLTIVLSIPTIIGSFYGMNVGGMYPSQNTEHGFVIVVIASLIITGLVTWSLKRKDML